MLVRFTVNVLGYAPGDEVELEDEWVKRLVPGHAVEVKKAEETKAVPAAPEAPKAVATKAEKADAPKRATRRD